MKTADELKAMLFERLAEIQRGGLTERYDEQCRIELALLFDIVGEDIDAIHWDEIEKAM
jgi:hypothetical protein